MLVIKMSSHANIGPDYVEMLFLACLLRWTHASGVGVDWERELYANPGG